MRPFVYRLTALGALLASAAAMPAAMPPAYAQGFTQPLAVKDAERLDAKIRALGRPARQNGAELKRAGLKQLADKAPADAIRSLSSALSIDAKDASTWSALARAYLAATPDASGAERYDFPAFAAGAAWRAYTLSPLASERAAALVTLSEALKARSLWRPAIEALEASLLLASDSGARAALETLRNEHGFRMIDYKIDAEIAEPRLCLNFSEKLAGSQGDLAKFVTLDGRDPQNVTSEGKQICIEGLQHGKRYEVQVRSGIPAETGEALAKSAELGVYVRDRAPSVRFSGRAYVLPNQGQQGIPVVTVNADKVGLEIYRIGDRGLAGISSSENFLKQMHSYDMEQLREKHGQKVWQGNLDVANRANEDVTTALPVSEAVPKLEPGVYVIAAAVTDKAQSDDNAKAMQWFIVSDLGLTAMSGADGVHAFVRSLASTSAVGGVMVRLVARNNEVLGTARTDASGYVKFDAGLKRGEGGMAPALLVAESGTDYAFLDLGTSAFDLTDRGVKGREQPGALDAYLFPERGVYRPGETVNLTGLVRDRNGRAASLPATLVVIRPDGVEHRRLTLGDQGLGGRTTALALAPTSMTGTWRAKLHADPKADPIAQTAFLVEDFVPERLDLKLESAAPSLVIDETGKISVTGKFLYGPPAAGLDMEGEIVVKPAAADLPGFAGYRFGLADEKITAVRKPLEDLQATDENGKAEIAVRLPPLPRTLRPLEATVLVKLRESAGRTIERALTLPVAIDQPRVGVRPLFKDNIGQGETAEFDVILVGADGKKADASKLKWDLVKLDQRWQWYSRDGSWGYEPITSSRKLKTGVAESTDTKPARIAVETDWGRYRLDVTTTEAGGPVTSFIFNSGWWGGESIDSPEMLELALDKPAYKAGETARVRIASKEGGRALVAVLGNGLLASKEVDVPAGGGEIPVEVKADWMPGAYVAATLYRAMDETAKRMPSRAIGVRWLTMDTSGATLKVALDAPRSVKPSAEMAVPVEVAGLKAGEEARITVAAVDVGILNLTRFESPAPEKWFHAQRTLGVELRDFYGRLIDGMRAERGRLRSGGDGGGLSLKGSPPVEAPLSLFSGIVPVGADGKARVSFTLPDFNGTVRLMAVAWSGDKVGSASKDVVVRDVLALTATAPRFLLLGDKARLDLSVHNVEGPAAGYKVAVDEEPEAGTLRSLASRDLQLKAGERKAETLDIAPASLGRSVYAVKVTGPDGIEVRRRVAVEVKAPAGDIKRVTATTLAAKGGKLTLSKDMLADFIPGTARMSLVAGPTARLDVPSLLSALDRYPYGCAEQTTSRALPLLYLSQLSARIGLAKDDEIRGRIEKAIERVFEMQDASGAFGVWGPVGGDLWLTAYVTDFLTRAKELGFPVRQQPFSQALDKLANYLSYAQDFERGGEARAYALYVLARNGRANAGDLRYYADTRLDRFATPLAQAQIGAALALGGDKERADRAFKAAISTVTSTSDYGPWSSARHDYGSFLRDGAALLTLASETSSAKGTATALTDVLAKVYRTRTYTSTQEQAWMVLAARALGDAARDTSVTIDGQASKGEVARNIDTAGLAARNLELVNQGDQPLDTVVSVTGTSLTPEPAISKGFTIRRSYYTLDGQKLDLKSAEGGASALKQNDRLVAVVEIEGEEAGGRVMLVDRLPAGFEIENPRLVEGGDLKGLDWLQKQRDPEHTEFRDDRFVAAFDFFGDQQRGERRGANVPVKATVAYIVRAVTPGSFVHPAATVEDMYRPERFARTAAGRLDVVRN